MIADADLSKPSSNRLSERLAGTTGLLVELTLFLAVAALVVTIVLSQTPILGYRAVILTGGSMEPALPIGSVVISRQAAPEELESGDIITFRHPDSKFSTTHRIVGVREESGVRRFTVKGDANDTPDPREISFDSGRAYKHRFSVPYAGYVLVYLANPYGMLLIGVSLAGLAAMGIFSRKGERTRVSDTAPEG